MFQYDNGVKVLFIHNDNSEVVSVKVFTRVGAIDEKPSQAGLSHFIEHLMFKGSKNFIGDSFSRNVENMGGYINAETSKDYTAYYVNIHKDGAKKIIKMLADTVSNPLFNAPDIDRERKVVIEEIQRHLDNPFSTLGDMFFENIYKESAMKNSIIGTQEIIAGVSRDEIYDYYQTHYAAGKMLVVVCGNFDEAQIKPIIDESFGKFEKKEIPHEPPLKESLHKGNDLTKNAKVENGYMISGFIGPDSLSQDFYAAGLSAEILAGGNSSRLYKVLKEEKKLVYEIDCAFYAMKGNGLFYMDAVFDEKNISQIKEEMQNQIADIINKGASDEELNRAKISLKTSWNFSAEIPSKTASMFGYWTLMERKDLIDNYLSKIESVNKQSIKDFFAKYGAKDLITNIALVPIRSSANNNT
ncbi:MAG: insulinase family protein [Elusimicrobiota bacterium]|jgi:predicted Zn-dependent peptidase|nr:insulinase family protein [Elusimicrobiota bacterium]